MDVYYYTPLVSRESSGVRYSVRGGGPQVAVTCSPSASASVDEDADSWSCGVDYSVSISPVTITLTGTTVDSSGGQNILIGQHCTSSLSGTVGTVTYQWSVSGATFQTWSSDTPTPYNPDASYYVDGPGDLTVASPGWYWHDIGNGSSKPETVSCTATVTPPAGEGSIFTVTATKQVTVWVPNWTCTGTGGTMQVNTTAPSSSGGDYWLWAGPISGSGTVGGMDWEATVSTPAPTLFGDGSVIMVQLIIPDLSYTTLNMFGLNSTYTWSLNGQEGLDTDYPYPWTEQPPSYSFYFSNDNPGLNLTATGALSGHVADQFEDYLMYFAPGSVQCVPLAHFVWNTDGNASIPSPGGWPAFSGSAGSITPSNSATSFLRSNSFPMWTQNSGNNPPSSGHF